MPLNKVLPKHCESYWRLNYPNCQTKPDNFPLEALVRNQRKHAIYEPSLQPIFSRSIEGNIIYAYDFFGVRFAPSSSQYFWRMFGSEKHAMEQRLSNVAALVLDLTFGAENIVWDRHSDRILVKTEKEFSLSLQGTNVVEAAVYLPRIYTAILARFPEGKQVASVHVQIEGAVREEAWGPPQALNIRLRLPNPYHTPIGSFDRLAEEALERSLGNLNKQDQTKAIAA